VPEPATVIVLAATTPAGPSADLLGAATNIFVIVSVLVAIIALGWAFRTRRNAVEIQNYRALAESYEKVTQAQKLEIEELQRARADDDQKIRQLQAKLDALTDIVTGKTALDGLAKRTADGFRDLKQGQAEIVVMLTDLTRRGAA